MSKADLVDAMDKAIEARHWRGEKKQQMRMKKTKKCEEEEEEEEEEEKEEEKKKGQRRKNKKNKKKKRRKIKTCYLLLHIYIYTLWWKWWFLMMMMIVASWQEVATEAPPDSPLNQASEAAIRLFRQNGESPWDSTTRKTPINLSWFQHISKNMSQERCSFRVVLSLILVYPSASSAMQGVRDELGRSPREFKTCCRLADWMISNGSSFGFRGDFSRISSSKNWCILKHGLGLFRIAWLPAGQGWGAGGWSARAALRSSPSAWWGWR